MDFLELLSGSNPFLSKCLRVVVGFKQLEGIGYRGSHRESKSVRVQNPSGRVFLTRMALPPSGAALLPAAQTLALSLPKD